MDASHLSNEMHGSVALVGVCQIYYYTVLNLRLTCGCAGSIALRGRNASGEAGS